MSITHALPQPVPLVVDTAGVGLIVGAFFHALPPIAAFLAVVWYVIQISESDTFRKMIDMRRSRYRRQGTLHHNHRAIHHHKDPPDE